MPRLQTLSAIQPNKYYNIEATLKYTHISNQKITAIIEQDNIQKKIMLPMTNIPLQLGCSYSFQKCFYSKNGWIRLNQSENIKLLQDGSAQYIELSQIYQHRAALNNCYVSTIVEIIYIGEQETFVKNGQELRLVKMKVFANDMLAEVSIWNQQLSPLILIGQKVTLSGFRVKTITPKSVSLTSTVYSTLHVVQGESISSFDAKANYQNISQIYINRTLAQMTSDTASENITHSLLHAHVQEVMAFDYEGCLKCRKKLQTEQCPVCEQKVKGKLVVMQLILSDESGSQMVYVFDNNLLGLFKLCKKGTTLDIKLKSTKRTMEEQDTISHIITNVVSIYF